METRGAKKEEKKRNTHSYRKHGLVSKFKVNTYKVTVTMFILLGNNYNNNNNLTESLVHTVGRRILS